MRRWDSLMERYLDDRYVATGRAPATIKNVRRELERFGLWVKSRRPRPRLEEITNDHIVKYIQGRSSFHGKWTLLSVMSHLRGMGEYLTEEGYWDRNPLRWMQGPKVYPNSRLPKRIKPDALKDIWETAATQRQGFHRWQWMAVLGVLCGTGARRSELVQLDLSDWDREQGLLHFRDRKTPDEHIVPVPPLTYRVLEAYLPQRQNHLEELGVRDEQALFVNRYGARVKKNGLSQGVKKLVTRAGHEWVSMHKFRHTCASELLEEGANLREVQRLLGHRSISSTVRYLHVADRQIHEAIKAHPINEFLKGGTVQ